LAVNELVVVFALIFATAVLILRVVAGSALRTYQGHASVNRRLNASRRPDDASAALAAVRSVRGVAEFHSAILRHLNDLLVQTGLNVDRRRLSLLWLSATAVWLIACSLVVGAGPKALAIAVVGASLSLLIYFRSARQRRIARFAALLPDTIDIIVRGLRVGYPLPSALDLVAREMPEPISGEFRMTCDEIAFGLDLRTAIENLHRRVGQEDLLFLVMAINVQNQTGGNLAQILAGLARLLRNRSKLALKVRALSADGRMSAVVLSLIPFILIGGIQLISPSYFGEVRHHPAMLPALIYAAVSLTIGNVIMYKMVNFRF
jgi:tight adherence protein B